MGGLTNTDESLLAAQPSWRGVPVAGRSVRDALGMLLIAGGY
jgi:hypothetical protein